jgi:hypothetical protein
MQAARHPMLRALATFALVAMLAGCGGKDDESASAKRTPTAAQKAARAAKAASAKAEEQMANAVAVGKATAAVDLQYDLSAKPVAGQPLEVELVFVPRLGADSLEVEAHGMTGLDVVTGGSASFQNVAAGVQYRMKMLVQPAANGIYYIGVTAKMSTKVQSDARAFSVPIVVGDPPPAAQPAAAAAGTAAAPVKSMKAEETTK